jgi:hypothetical protein
LPAGTFAADTEHVLGSGIQVNNEEIVVEKDDARVQALENIAGVASQGSVAGTAAS